MKRFFKAVWIFIPAVLAAAMYFLLPYFPTVTEYVFSRGLFKLVTVPVGFVTSLLPFSLTELLVVIALPLIVTLIAVFAVRLKKSADRKKTALRAARGVCGFVSFALAMYMICHGANFYRYPMEQLMELDTSKKSADHLLAVCKELVREAAKAGAELDTDENGCTKLPEDILTELSRTGSGYEPLIKEYPFLWTSVWRQKPVMLSEQWSYTLITGMYFPFFAECNVNTAQPEFGIPFTAAHESAHSRGIAFENECNYMAFLSCINSEYAEFRYSGYMEALRSCTNDLYRYDKEMWAEAMSGCTETMLRDLNAVNVFIADHTGKTSETAGKANDTFIKVQGVKDGELSYGRVSALILAYYDKVWNE